MTLSQCFGLFSMRLIKSFATWPKFSLTSYMMVAGLARQKILPRTVIDVGANVGQFAVAASKLFPNVVVHSFEPNPECVSLLRRHVEPLGNVLVYPLALGDESGALDFHINSHSHSSSLLPLAENHSLAFPEARELNIIQVEVSTLDKVFCGNELSKPVMLKLDVQGYEAQALRGAIELLSRVDYVILEASFKPMYQGELLFMEIVHMMEGYGFTFLRPVGWLPDPHTGEIIQMDSLFVSRIIGAGQ
jgi:FkbM family methyltransferase